MKIEGLRMSTPPIATGDDSVVEVLKKALERADEPITAKQLREQLTGPYKLAVDKLEQILTEQVSLGSAFRFEPYKGKSPRYWSRNLEQYARAAMIKRLSRRPETSGDLLRGLKSPLKGYSPDRLRQLLRELVEGGHARELPTFVRSRTKRFSTNPPDPRDYLRDALEDIYRKLDKAGIAREQVNAAALELLERAPAVEPPETELPPPPPEPPPEGTGPMILERMVAIKPEAAT